MQTRFLTAVITMAAFVSAGQADAAGPPRTARAALSVRFGSESAAQGFATAIRCQRAVRWAMPADELRELPDGGGGCDGRFYSHCLAAWGHSHLVARLEGRTVDLHVAGYPEGAGRAILRRLLAVVAEDAPRKGKRAALLAERERHARAHAARAAASLDPDSIEALERQWLSLMIEHADFLLDMPAALPQFSRLRRWVE